MWWKVIGFLLINWKSVYELIKTIIDAVSKDDSKCAKEMLGDLKEKCKT